MKLRFGGRLNRDRPWLRPRPSSAPITSESTASRYFEVSEMYSKIEKMVSVFRGILSLVLYKVF